MLIAAALVGLYTVGRVSLLLLIVLIGAVSFNRLTVREYPKIDEPVVTVTVRYANNALVTAYDPASGTFRADVWQH